MNGWVAVILSLEGLFFVFCAVALIVLIFTQYAKRKKEKFEKRDN